MRSSADDRSEPSAASHFHCDVIPLIERLGELCAGLAMSFGGPHPYARGSWAGGYRDGQEAAGPPSDGPAGWREGVPMGLDIFRIASGPVRILQHAHGPDAAALQAVPGL